MQSWQSTSKKQRHIRGRGATKPAADRCLQIVDAGLLAILFLAPLFLGGRDALGKLVFIVLACIIGVAWFTRQSLLKKQVHQTRSWAYPLAIAAIAMLALQLVPLPWNWLQQLSPRNSSLLTLWQGEANSPAQLGVWQTLSLTPSATKLALAMLIAYVLLFVATVGRLQTVDDIGRLLRLMAISVVAMGTFGLVQYFASNGRFFWFYEYPFVNTKTYVLGSFTSRNHFAHYLVLGIGPLLAWIALRGLAKPQTRKHHGTAGSERSPFAQNAPLYAGLTLVVFAVLLSVSRGGVLALALASTVTIAIYYRRGFLSSSYLYGVAVLGLLVVGLLSLYGYDSVSNRLDDFTAGSIESLDSGGGRRKIWSANLAAIGQGGLFGAGAGSHREIYPTYLPESLDLHFTHAENGYLQIATENGWLGATLLGCTLLLISSWCWRANRRSKSKGPQSKEQLILAGAVTASLAASLVHSLVDFVWYIPACMTLTILLAACVLRLAQLAGNEQQPTSSVAWPPIRRLCMAATVLLAASWAILVASGPGTAATHWNQFRLASAASRARSITTLVKNEQQEAETLKEAESLTQVMIYHLRYTLRSDPSSASAHARLASKYLLLFQQRQINADNSMSVSQIRAAATASRFASAQELRQWLTRAFGKNSQLLYQSHYHARRALQLCPLQGENYLVLSDLCFLQGQSQAAIQAYIDQGLLLRPYDFKVVFAVGEQLSTLGRDDEALAHWQRIFRYRGKHQLRIIQILSRVMPAASFVELFHPDWQTLHYVWKVYRHSGSEQDGQTIANYSTKIAQRDCPEQPAKQAVVVWRTLASMFKDLGNLQGVLHCYQHAPNQYSVRRELGRTYLQLDLYPQAEPYLRWCLARRPEDTALKAEMIHATKRFVVGKTVTNNQSSYQ